MGAFLTSLDKVGIFIYNEFMNYESTLKQFHKYKKEEFEAIFNRKFNAPDALHFNITVGGHPAFFYFCYDFSFSFLFSIS